MTLFNRWDVAKQIIELLRNDSRLAGAVVEPGWPGELNSAPRTIWIDELAGDITYPHGQAGRKTRDDRYTIPFLVRVVDQPTLDATMAALQEVCQVIDDTVADDPTADQFANVMHCLVESARLTVMATPDGHIGWAQVIVAPFARYL